MQYSIKRPLRHPSVKSPLRAAIAYDGKYIGGYVAAAFIPAERRRILWLTDCRCEFKSVSRYIRARRRALSVSQTVADGFPSPADRETLMKPISSSCARVPIRMD